MNLSFDDLDQVDTDGLGFDFASLIKTGIETGTALDAQRRAARLAAQQAAADARLASQQSAEAARERAIIAGRAPGTTGIPIAKVVMIAAAAIVLPIIAIKLLRRSRR